MVAESANLKVIEQMGFKSHGCKRLNIKQVHRAGQALLPAQVDCFVGCSLDCALHPPASFLGKMQHPLQLKIGFRYLTMCAALETGFDTHSDIGFQLAQFPS